MGAVNTSGDTAKGVKDVDQRAGDYPYAFSVILSISHRSPCFRMSSDQFGEGEEKHTSGEGDQDMTKVRSEQAQNISLTHATNHYPQFLLSLLTWPKTL